jgi:hypothetical protein
MSFEIGQGLEQKWRGGERERERRRERERDCDINSFMAVFISSCGL